MKAIVITADGTAQVKELNGYDDLVKEVDGWLEVIRISHDAVGYLDEEGKPPLGNKPVNQRATTLLQDELKIGLHPDDYIVGTLVIVGCLNEEGKHDGDDHDVPQHLITRIIGDA